MIHNMCPTLKPPESGFFRLLRITRKGAIIIIVTHLHNLNRLSALYKLRYMGNMHASSADVLRPRLNILRP